MKAATNIFFTLAVAINSLQCTAYVVVPPPSTLSSFVGVTSYAAQVAIRGKEKYSTTSIGTRRTSSTTCIYSVPYLPNIEEEDDGSFFLRASQQASKDRYEMLKQGKDPLAVSLSASVKEEEPNQQQQHTTVEKEEVSAVNDVSDSSGSSADAESTSSPTLAQDDYDGLLSSLAESPLAKSLEEENVDTEQDTDVKKSSSSTPLSTLDEIKRVEDEIAAVKSQMKYRFQKRLMDARMAYNNNVNRVGEGSTAEEMEAARNARLTAADEVAKILQSGEELEEVEVEASVPTTASTSTVVDAGEGSTAEEMEEARNARLAAADEIAKTLKKTVESTAETSTVSLEEEENEETKAEPSELETQPVSSTPPLSSPPPAAASTKIEEESSNTAKQPLVSSDGKAIYEPSQSALSINQENVDNGLMVLTRSFLVLNSIVQRLDKDKE